MQGGISIGERQILLELHFWGMRNVGKSSCVSPRESYFVRTFGTRIVLLPALMGCFATLPKDGEQTKVERVDACCTLLSVLTETN